LGADHHGVPFRRVTIELEDGPNLEARARDARRSELGLGALTGHTADDQAETVVLNLLRGAGATGLAAMRPGATHPILGLRRAETRALCDKLDLRPAHDPSNDDPRFRRNRVRHELLRLAADVADRDLTPLLSRTADLLRDDDDFLSSLAAQIDPTDAVELAAAPSPVARRAVRRWLTNGTHPPDSAGVERVLAVARGETIACDVAGIGRISRSRQRLHLDPA
jgi:tRNA(Ile)-lysidine synthase